MSSPRIIVQILVTGTQIFGKALLAAAKQAAKNARTPAQGVIGNDAAGVGTATSGSITDTLTRSHRMTLDEARLILDVKRGDDQAKTMRHYEYLFKANSPPPPPPPDAAPAGKRQPVVAHSHYLQSKVVRARERLEAEIKGSENNVPPEAPPPDSGGASTGTP